MPAHRDFPPRLMPSPTAAYYLGVSESTLRKLEIRRKSRGAKRLYDKADLDDYIDRLPYELEGTNTCDELFD